MTSGLFDWLALRDYDKAKKLSTDKIIRRQARGNVSVQNGWYMTRPELMALSRQADKHMENLHRLLSR